MTDRGGHVLVTGGAGFIGSHTVDALVEKGYRVRILDSLQPRVHPNGKPSWVPSEAEFLQGDVANRADLSSAIDGVDYVIHLAAYQDYMPDFSRFLHAPVDLLCGEMVHLEPESHVVKDVHVWVERVVLEDHRSVAVFGVHPIDQAVADVDTTRAGFI